MTDTPPPGPTPDDSAGLPPADATVVTAGEDTIGAPPPPGQTLSFDTTLRPSSFFGLSLKNGLLNLITLTLWRFWGKTEVRRRVWQGIRLNGDAFEYTGRGVELFVGFLLALLVLGLPFLLLVFAAQFLGPMYAALIILPLYVFIFWLYGFGVFTAYRYMASRTTWRGIRFRLGGSATGFGFKYMGILLLNGITMGWYSPMGERQLAETLWSNLRFGNRPFRFYMGRAEQEGVYGAFALGWFLTALPYILLIVIMVAITAAVAPSGAYPSSLVGALAAAPPPPEPGSVPPTHLAVMGLFYLAMLPLVPLVLLIWAPYQAAILRSVTAGVGVDGATFKLEVKAIALWWLIVTNLFFLLITLGFLMPWVQARTARFLVERLKSKGEARVDEAVQTGTGPGSGEGLADAFGFSLI